jgi:rubrerythrin
MKTRFFVFVAIVAAAFIIGGFAGEEHAKLNPKTKENLSTAMHGEAFAYAKYLMFADHARKNGHADIADLFEQTAKQEHMEHLREEAEIAGVVGNDEANLKDAIKGENYETTTMYPQFAEQAKAAGDKDAADRFAEIARDETKHRDSFKAALAKLEKESGKKTVGSK